MELELSAIRKTVLLAAGEEQREDCKDDYDQSSFHIFLNMLVNVTVFPAGTVAFQPAMIRPVMV